MRLAFITNNASRPPEVVAEHLRELGVEADTSDVVTSAQAAARVLAERFGAERPGGRAGRPGAGRRAAAEAVWCRSGSRTMPSAVVTGYGPDVLLARDHAGAVRIRDGLPWVASNTDLTIPTTFGVAPGHGVLVEMLPRLRRRASRWSPASRSDRCSTRRAPGAVAGDR